MCPYLNEKHKLTYNYNRIQLKNVLTLLYSRSQFIFLQSLDLIWKNKKNHHFGEIKIFSRNVKPQPSSSPITTKGA